MADTAKSSANQPLLKGKQATCEFYMKRLLPRKDLHKANLLLSADDLMAVNGSQFDYI